MHKLIWFSSTMPEFIKIYDTSPRKRSNRWTDRSVDGRVDRAYFIEPFRLLPWVQNEGKKRKSEKK